MARGSHSFNCHPHVYPRMQWAILHALRKHSPDGVARARWRTSGSAHYSSIDPEKMKGWVGLGGWLHPEIKCRLRKMNPDTSPIPVLTGLDVQQLRWYDQLRYHYATPPLWHEINSQKTKTSYDLRPGNREGLFWFRSSINLSLTYLLMTLTHLVTVPGPTRDKFQSGFWDMQAVRQRHTGCNRLHPNRRQSKHHYLITASLLWDIVWKNCTQTPPKRLPTWLLSVGALKLLSLSIVTTIFQSSWVRQSPSVVFLYLM